MPLCAAHRRLQATHVTLILDLLIPVFVQAWRAKVLLCHWHHSFAIFGLACFRYPWRPKHCLLKKKSSARRRIKAVMEYAQIWGDYSAFCPNGLVTVLCYTPLGHLHASVLGREEGWREPGWRRGWNSYQQTTAAHETKIPANPLQPQTTVDAWLFSSEEKGPL